jgi:hypothetical protein
LTGEDLGNTVADLANAANHARSFLIAEMPSNSFPEEEDQEEEKNKEENFDISKLS